MKYSINIRENNIKNIFKKTLRIGEVEFECQMAINSKFYLFYLLSFNKIEIWN